MTKPAETENARDAAASSDRSLATQLEEMQGHLRSILDSVPDAMVVIDETGTIKAFSKAAEKLFGYRPEDVIGENVARLMTGADEARHDDYIANYLSTGERRIIGIGRVVTARKADGTRFPIDLKIGEAHYDGHSLFTGFMRDLTEQQQRDLRMREMQAELVHFSRLSTVGTMASALAHELNQPLTAVANYLEGARDLLEDPDKETLAIVRDALDEAAKQSVRAGQIVRKLRDYVSRGEISARPVPLEPLLLDALSLARIGLETEHVRFDREIDHGIGEVLVDPIQVQQVVVNLVRNALEALGEQPGAAIVLSAVPGPGTSLVTVSIADNGPGIAPEIADQLFRPFTSSKSSGMGLGLSICQTIVEAHGGTIKAERATPSGTRFVFTLRQTSSASPDHA